MNRKATNDLIVIGEIRNVHSKSVLSIRELLEVFYTVVAKSSQISPIDKGVSLKDMSLLCRSFHLKVFSSELYNKI